MIQIQLVSYARSRHLPLLASTFAATFPPLVTEQRESRASEGGGLGETAAGGKTVRKGEEESSSSRCGREEEEDEEEKKEEREEEEEKEVVAEEEEEERGKGMQSGEERVGREEALLRVWRSAEENVGDNLPLPRRFRLRTTNYHPFLPPGAPLARPSRSLRPLHSLRT